MEVPQAKLHRAIWHDMETNQLKWWDQGSSKWRKYFEREFKLTENIMSTLPPEDPVRGELWIYNGVLCYYDGINWAPIKALLQDGSQFSLDVFRNFLLVSPLWRIGNTIVEDDEIESYKTELRKYLQGVLDGETDSMITGDGEKYSIDQHQCIENPPQVPAIPFNKKAQLLVPNIDNARIFLDHELDTEKFEEVSKVCIQYDKRDLINSTPSLVHINPGRMTRIVKRIIKIDRDNPRIQIPAADTEFYGFHESQYFGDLLLPDQEKKEDDGTVSVEPKDYTIVEDGILLSYNASQNYDYVLAITYEFSWMKSTGRMDKSCSKDATNAYFVDKYNGPFNVFVEGYNYEDPYYETDSMSQTIKTKEDTRELEVSLLHVPKREYGYMRTINVAGEGIIRPLRDYKNPLVFVNGEALSEQNGDIIIESDGLIRVRDAKDDMAWCIVDLFEEANEKNEFKDYTPTVVTGKVGNDNLISYDASVVPDQKTCVLFIDGLLVKKEAIEYDRANCKIDVEGGLTAGQEYILVEDKYGWLYNEEALQPALSVGKFSDSLVYFNNHLICNNVAIDTSDEPYTAEVYPDGTKVYKPYPGVFNEIKNFKSIYDDVIEMDTMDDLDALIKANTGRHELDIEREVEKQVREELADKGMSDGQITSEVEKAKRRRVFHSGVLYYIKDTKDGYVGEKNNFDEKYPCKIQKVFSNDDTDAIREIQRDSIGNIVQIANSRYRIFDIKADKWVPMAMEDIPKVKAFAYSYENMPRSIRLLLPYSNKDVIQTYAFNLANAIEHPLIIKSVDVRDEDKIYVNGQYVFGANSLRVWCNGIRQYPNTAPTGDPPNGIIESLDGKSFKLPEKFTGMVTYVIELPEKNQAQSCSMEILDRNNVLPDHINMYKTKMPLFPGRVTIYVNGIRLGSDQYSIMDNHTLLIDNEEPLLGSTKNFPSETFVANNKRHTIHWPTDDKLLVEVRQDDRVETTFECKGHPVFELPILKYGIDPTILEAADEIMIFVNGLYFGPTKNEGYSINISRGAVSVTQEEILEIMNHDEEDIFLKGNEEYYEHSYKAVTNGQPYEQKNALLTLEWR